LIWASASNSPSLKQAKAFQATTCTDLQLTKQSQTCAKYQPDGEALTSQVKNLTAQVQQ
jgi:hypothetical protein